MKKETYMQKMMGKRVDEFLEKHEKGEDITFDELMTFVYTVSSMTDVINDLDQRIRRLEKKCQKF